MAEKPNESETGTIPEASKGYMQRNRRGAGFAIVHLFHYFVCGGLLTGTPWSMESKAVVAVEQGGQARLPLDKGLSPKKEVTK
jgi:hypothetical protein